MDLLTSMDVSASGLGAQRIRINVISMNLANIHTTRTLKGGPYLRKSVLLAAVPMGSHFDGILEASLDSALNRVQVVGIVDGGDRIKRIYDPSHPDADGDGYLTLPDINVMEEMTNMLMASRSYEANVTAFQAAKNMALKAIDMAR